MSEPSGPTLPLLPSWISRYIDRWISKKNRSDKNYTTRRQNIYILPSKTGVFFVVVLIIILIGAINYNNSLAYMLCFFLSSLGFVDMLQTHQNLKNIQISYHKSDPAFSGQLVRHHLVATNTDHKKHTAIQILSETRHISSFYLSQNENQQHIEITQTTHKRGLQPLSQFKLYTEYPLGLFHAWSQIRLDASAVIYPRPLLAEHTETTDTVNDKVSAKSLPAAGDDFAGIREFRKTDSPRAMAWKKIAQTGLLYSKNFESELNSSLVFRMSDITHTENIEVKLSILCHLVTEAAKNSLEYGLDLNGRTTAINSGTEHMHNCLRELALYTV
jgi:uncharacterized protein (DUF58 family)